MLSIRPILLAGSIALSAASALADPLNAQERAGQRLYLEGVTLSGEPVRALVGAGQTPLSGGAVACGNCHGADGKGRVESTVAPPEVTWEALTKPYGHIHPTRKHGPFAPGTLARAVNEGLDPAGNVLDWAMPRFALAREDLDALAAYLRRLSATQAPGVGEATLRIGTVLPAAGPAAPAAEAAKQALLAYFELINRQGGVHQRMLELSVAVTPANARDRFEAAPVFALVSPFGGAPGDGLSVLLEQARLPAVGPITPQPDAGGGAEALAFYLHPGPNEMGMALVEFASRRSGGAPSAVAILTPEAPAQADVTRAPVQRCERRDCPAVVHLSWERGRLDAAGMVARLRSKNATQVLFTGSEDELGELVSALGRAGEGSQRMSLYVAGTLARAALSGRQKFAGEVFAAVPTLPGPSSPAARREWDAIRSTASSSGQHAATQLAALNAAAVLVEALRRAGRELTREGLVRALESLSRFDTGFGPPVSFGPGLRIGARGAYVMAIDRAGRFTPASGWLAVD